MFSNKKERASVLFKWQSIRNWELISPRNQSEVFPFNTQQGVRYAHNEVLQIVSEIGSLRELKLRKLDQNKTFLKASSCSINKNVIIFI
jgi:hypothetical protein